MLLFLYISPSTPLSPCLQVYSLCLFLHWCPVNKFFSTIFLDSVYMCQNTVFIFLFLTHFTLYNRFQVHPPHQKLIQMCSFLWLIFHCVYIPQNLYPFICRWTSRLLSCSSYCKQCCNEQWDTCISFNFGFLRVYAQEWDFWVIR